MITDKNIRAAKELQSELEYVIELLKKNNLNYINARDLGVAIKGISLDISDYLQKQKTICPALKEEAIILISESDGLAVYTKSYYLIKKISDTNIQADLICVKLGEYISEIKFISGLIKDKAEWLKEYNNNEHVDNVPEETWDSLLKYVENIPWD